MRQGRARNLLTLPFAIVVGAVCVSAGATTASPPDVEWNRLNREFDAWFSAWLESRHNEQSWSASCDALRDFRNRLHTIDRHALSNAVHRESYDVLDHLLREYIVRCDYDVSVWPIGPFWGIHRQIATLALSPPLRSVADFERYVNEVRLHIEAIDDAIVQMRRGMAQSRTLPRSTIEHVPAEIDLLLAEGLEKLESPIGLAWDLFPGEARDRLWARFVRDDMPRLRAAVMKLREFIAAEYLPACRSSVAITDLPAGDAHYQLLLETLAETSRTPAEVHELGQAEVARLRREIVEAVRRTTFYTERNALSKLDDDGLFQALREFMLRDSAFYAQDEEQILRGYRDICKRVDHWLPVYFHTLPRLPFGVAPTPTQRQESGPVGYLIGDLKEGVASVLWIQLSDLRSHPTWAMAPYALHEGAPGHHLQLALARELDGLPSFRRNHFFIAFGEGWAMYAEQLGYEMQLYDDPYEHIGQLNSEIHRACRLAVDPGIHALEWSREKAYDFLRNHTLLTDSIINQELDRCIAWPGQMVAYKIGELRIRELRARAEKDLGAKFDIREFHDVVLGAGNIPLSVLERRVNDWIAATNQR